MNKCCENCRFWKGLEVTGACSAPLPDSVRFSLGRKLMFATAGTNCGAYRKRIVRRSKPPGPE